VRTVVRFGLAIVLAACAGEDAPDQVVVDPNDVDGDGIANADDNCPDNSNVDQHDEDGDVLGDRCDNCPTVANADQADTTEVAVDAFADGVGNACDLRPGLAGDEIGRLFAFATDAEIRGFVGSGWTIAGDQLRLDPGVTASWRGARGEMGDGLAVWLAIDSTTWTDNEAFVQVELDGLSICTLRHTPNGDVLEAGERDGVPVTANLDPSATTAMTLIAWRRITSAQDEIECRVMRGGETTVVEQVLTDDLVVGSYALYTSGDVGVAIGSLVVYTSPGPKTP
jgi:hypothetical protein